MNIVFCQDLFEKIGLLITQTCMAVCMLQRSERMFSQYHMQVYPGGSVGGHMLSPWKICEPFQAHTNCLSQLDRTTGILKYFFAWHVLHRFLKVGSTEQIFWPETRVFEMHFHKSLCRGSSNLAKIWENWGLKMPIFQKDISGVSGAEEGLKMVDLRSGEKVSWKRGRKYWLL